MKTQTRFDLFETQLANARYLIGTHATGKAAADGRTVAGVVRSVESGMVDYTDHRPARILVTIATAGGWYVPCELETVQPAHP